MLLFHPKIVPNRRRALLNKPKDIPNFAAWSNENLAKFCTDSYLRMQEQQEVIEQLQQNWKDAMQEIRRMIKQQG